MDTNIKNSRLEIRIPTNLKTELQAYAHDINLSMSEILIQLIIEKLVQEGYL